MRVRKILVLFLIILIMGQIMAYSGFNRVYYTHNFQQTYYQPTPFTTYTNIHYPTTYTSFYSPSFYSPSFTTFYSNYSYVNMTPNIVTYYPTYYSTIYPTYYTTYSRTISAFPTNYRDFYVYKDNTGWGFGIRSGSLCGIYGYC